MKTALFDFDLPKKFIAQKPVNPRDHSKLLVYDTSKDRLFHKRFFNLIDFLKPGDVLVVNNSKVIPARITFKGKEIFILKKIAIHEYLAMVRPGKFFKLGKKFTVHKNINAEVTKICNDGTRILKFDVIEDLDIKLRKIGKTPLPPYIKSEKSKDQRYQTVYAKEEGSVAAPTAGLHFTKRLLNRLKLEGINVLEVVLHVSRGTFLPVTSESIEKHKMHAEFFSISNDTAKKLNDTVKKSGRIIAVGTTAVRVLESNFSKGKFLAQTGETNIFIYPGKYKWKITDGLITNFHLPKSTLIMLVASFLEHKGARKPIKKILELYELAKKKNYRFYSFGDATFIF